MNRFFKPSSLAMCLSVLGACGEAPLPSPPGEKSEPLCEVPLSDLPFATHVVDFTPGVNAGFGDAEFPEVVLGPPAGGGTANGALNVLSLGVGGEITLGFGDRLISNGDGPDFVVFENPFAIGGDRTNPFAELAQISVSNDGETWRSFDCDSSSDYPWTDCAGWRLVDTFSGCSPAIYANDTGGDLFDLATLGMEEARFIKIVDLSSSGGAPSAGFDLDAVGVFHFTPGP